MERTAHDLQLPRGIGRNSELCLENGKTVGMDVKRSTQYDKDQRHSVMDGPGKGEPAQSGPGVQGL
jgi:hypothetical protein